MPASDLPALVSYLASYITVRNVYERAYRSGGVVGCNPQPRGGRRDRPVLGYKPVLERDPAGRPVSIVRTVVRAIVPQ